MAMATASFSYSSLNGNRKLGVIKYASLMLLNWLLIGIVFT